MSTATLTTSRSLEHACLAAKVCDDLRAKDTIVLDLTGITPLFDYFVISTGNSRRQMAAIADEVRRTLKRYGSKSRGVEGVESSKWIVQDFGDVIVHVFTDEARGLYDLEHLWGDAPRVDWTELVDRFVDEDDAA
ncbi:MAG: ribosome silencing factor [Planctomycetaceae bacterium]